MKLFSSLHRRAFSPSRLAILMLPIIALLFALTPVRAQDQMIPGIAESLSARLDQIEATLARDALSDATFNDLREQLAAIEEEANTQKNLMLPTLQEAQARLETLKPAETEEGSEANPEAQELKDRRASLENQVAQLDGQFKLITSSLVRAKQLNNKITLTRQERFTEELFGRSGSLLNPLLWVEAASGLVTTSRAIGTLLSDWGSFLTTHAIDQIWQVAGMIIIVAALIVGPFRFLLFSGLARLAKLENPTSLQRSVFATWAVIVYTLLPISIFWAVTLVMSNADLLPSRVETLAIELSSVLFNVSLAFGLMSVLLAPNRPNYRLLNIETSDAIKLQGLGIILLIVYAFEMLVDETSTVLLTPLEVEIVISGTSCLLIAGLIWTGQRLLVSARQQREQATNESENVSQDFALPSFISMLQPLVWLLCLVIASAPILGYVSLGGFLAEQLGRIFVILALLGVLSALIDNFLAESLETGNERVQRASRAIGISTRAISQFGVLFNGILRVLLYVGAALLAFAPWGVQSTDFLTSLKNAIFNIQIGDLSISPINIMGALCVFAVGLVLVKSIQHWMERSLLPATNLDTGLKNSIQTGVGYVGFVIAAMAAFSYVGLDLSNIALVAGALSVGIGFGLQSIVNNFVSGLILLAERPIKTGDWVVVGGDQGFVKKISVRATKIETFDRAMVIVPNSELIANRVMNWMHGGSMGRIIVPVGVSYNSDPEQVRDILLKVAADSDYVASYPEPAAFFLDFGASSLDFDLRCYVQDVTTSLVASSQLRFDIFKAFKEAGIEIPFPQQDVYIRSIKSDEDQSALITPYEPDPANKIETQSDLKRDEIPLDTDASDAEGSGER